MKLEKQHIEKLKETYKEDSKKVIESIKFADKKHKGIKRDDGTPYILHPLRVAGLVEKYKVSKNASMLFMAAVLHDTIEDTYTSYRELCDRFGEETASIVMELSTAKFAPLWIGKGGKAEYLSKKMENMTNYALLIKLCDRLDNVSTLEGCSEKKRIKTIDDTYIILDYIKKVRTLTSSQETVIKEIERKLEEYKN